MLSFSVSEWFNARWFRMSSYDRFTLWMYERRAYDYSCKCFPFSFVSNPVHNMVWLWMSFLYSFDIFATISFYHHVHIEYNIDHTVIRDMIQYVDDVRILSMYMILLLTHPLQKLLRDEVDVISIYKTMILIQQSIYIFQYLITMKIMWISRKILLTQSLLKWSKIISIWNQCRCPR